MKHMVGKYKSQFMVDMKIFWEYKLNFLGNLISIPLQIIIAFLLWKIIYASSGKTILGGLTLIETISYIIFASFLSLALPTWTISGAVRDLVMRGGLVNILTKPINLFYLVYFRQNGSLFISALIGILIYYVIAPFLNLYYLTDPVYLILFLFSFILAISIAFALGMITGLATIWTGESHSLVRILSSFRAILSGEMIPLTLLPATLFKINSFLPFKYMMFVPVFIFMKQFSVQEALIQISFQLIMFIVLITLGQILYKKGIKKYEGFGG